MGVIADDEIFRSTVEALELSVRAARRCAYDLKHCVESLDTVDSVTAEVYRDRARAWIALFQSGNSVKDYRHELHRTIDQQETVIEKLRAVLSEHGIEDPTKQCF